MQANSAEHDSMDLTSSVLGGTPVLIECPTDEDAIQPDSPPVCFHGHFASCMEMYADAQTVTAYLDAHRAWFPRCAHPMKAFPLGETGYDLTIGRFGSFGYEVEAKIGLDLLPQNQGVYCIETIPIPGYEPPGYEVDFQARLQLLESNAIGQRSSPTGKITDVDWELNLTVTIQFPRFINALPKSLVQSTGDRLLNQIVRQVSRCLTHKVQEDFHHSAGIAFPKKRRFSWGKNKPLDEVGESVVG